VPTDSLKTSQFWCAGLQWDKAFSDGNALGFAFELWYKIQVKDYISVTPAVFHLSRPEGQETPSG
jgi:hypothetical protein